MPYYLVKLRERLVSFAECTIQSLKRIVTEELTWNTEYKASSDRFSLLYRLSWTVKKQRDSNNWFQPQKPQISKNKFLPHAANRSRLDYANCRMNSKHKWNSATCLRAFSSAQYTTGDTLNDKNRKYFRDEIRSTHQYFFFVNLWIELINWQLIINN